MSHSSPHGGSMLPTKFKAAFREQTLREAWATFVKLLKIHIVRRWQAALARFEGLPLNLQHGFKVAVLVLLGIIAYRGNFGFQLNMGNPSRGVARAGFGTESSEFAPADPMSLRDEQNIAYIQQFKSTAIEEMKRSGVPASITLAQAIIESRSGESRLAKDINNHFGIKCFSRSCKAGHCKNYTDDSHKDFFRAFKLVKDCYKAHSELLLNRRYTRLVDNTKDYKSWAYALQNGGYATGKQYAAKLIYVIERYKLYELDL